MRNAIPPLLLLLLLGACAASPEPRYYMLDPVSGKTEPSLAIVVRVSRPSLPAYLDRAPITRQTSGNQIVFDEQRRWASPLDKLFEDVLTQDLRQRLPNSLIVDEEQDVPSAPYLALNVTISTFNPTDDGAVLNGQYMIEEKHGCGDLHSSTWKSFALSMSNDDLAAQSTLIGNLADQIVPTMAAISAAACANAAPKL